MSDFLDTNILLRFMLGDVEEHTSFIKILFTKTAENKEILFITPEVLIELKYVLQAHYELSKKEILEAIQGFIDLGFIEVLTDYHLNFDEVLRTYSDENLSLEDCLFIQICLQNDLNIISFDKKLNNVFNKLKND
jgi:predicted nucleic-acid-binding protein